MRKNFEDNLNLTPRNKSKALKLQKDLKEYKDLYPIKKALSYLSMNDQPTKLLTVCKKWNHFLKNKISKIYLIKLNNETIMRKYRVNIWSSFLISEVILYYDYLIKLI